MAVTPSSIDSRVDPVRRASNDLPRITARAPASSISQRVFRAGFWNLLLRTLARSIGFVRNVVLARILAPEDIGLFGIVLVVLSILERFTTTGLQSALVQKRGEIHDYLDTSWTVHAVRGAGLGLLIVATAPYSAAFFGEPKAAALIQVLGLSTLLAGLQNPGVVQFQRELEFHRQFLLRSGGMIVELVVSVAFAIALQNAWALMIGLVARRVTALVLSYALHPYRPRIRWRRSQVRELSRFGRWVFLTNILMFLSQRGDNLIVGKLLGAPALGVYMLAYSISEVATVEITRLVNDIAFPAFSRLQDNLLALRRGLLLSMELVLSISLPVAALIWLLAEPLTLLLLGPRWAEVALILPPLALAGVLRTWVGSGAAALKGAGHANQRFWLGVVGVVGMYAAIFPLVRMYGLAGIAWAACLGQVACLPLFAAQMHRFIEISGARLLRTLVPGLLFSAASVMPLLFMGGSGVGRSPVAVFASLGLGAGLACVVAVALWKAGGTGPLQLLDLLRKARAGRPRGVASAESPNSAESAASLAIAASAVRRET
jgi:lipopolysaccharide exporter